MKKLSSSEIRRIFIDYFKRLDHTKINSSSVVPKDDNTLLYINSGMAPLKKYFLGLQIPPTKRLCNYQPCIRTNDIDDVGDRHHLTLFEMLGSWSIGDYYKEKAIAFAYDLLIKHFEFDLERIYVSVFAGDLENGIPEDKDSYEAWVNVGVSKSRILKFGKDNFWGPAGEYGPCGPCTEVFYDTGDQFGESYIPGGYFDTSRYIEVWNAGVFMELNKNKDGSFTKLPIKSVDTGAGLERLNMIMNGMSSVYETDLMAPIVAKVVEQFSVGEKESYIISDHIRTSVFILSEGVIPDNIGQGHVLRRLIRKAVSLLKDNFDFTPVVDEVINILKEFYPNLKRERSIIISRLKNEIDDFLPIIQDGLKMMDKEIEAKGTLSGEGAFNLVTTHGLPLEIIKLNLVQRGMALDEDSYNRYNEEHKIKSRVIKRGDNLTLKMFNNELLLKLLKESHETIFEGYENAMVETKIVSIIKDNSFCDHVIEGDSCALVFDKTVFYAESGGQVGDIGTISTNSGIFKVENTIKVNGVFLHAGFVKSGNITSGVEAKQTIDQGYRRKVSSNHSATHLLHAALHQVIGVHATQKGSLVTAERFRFDFLNKSGIPLEKLQEIELIVNKMVSANFKQQTLLLDYEDALEKGAIGLFGESYDKKVRVVSFRNSSMELCGGTHVRRSGEIGTFVIVSETSIAKGVRRIEALTGELAVKYLQKRVRIVKALSEELKSPVDVILDQITLLKSKLAELTKSRVEQSLDSITPSREFKYTNNDGSIFWAQNINIKGNELKSLGDKLIAKGEMDILSLFAIDSEKRSIRAYVWIKKEERFSQLNARAILIQILKPIEGKGGGNGHFAQGGGHSDNMDSIFLHLKKIIQSANFLS